MQTRTRPPNPQQNAHQSARWNGPEGELWVAEQGRFDRMLEPVDAALFAAAALRPGERVLDVGCGAGTTTLAAAWEVAPSGAVTGLDVSEPLIATAREWAASWPMVDFVIADAQTERFSRPFDVVLSRNGLMLFEGLPDAFTTIATNLRPGGRIAFATWAEAEANAWSAIPNAAVAAHVRLPSPPADGPCAFSLADPARVRALLRDAGFADVSMRRLDADLWVASDVSDAVAFVERSAPLPAAIASRVFATLRVSLAPYARPDGVWLPSASWIVTATLPATLATGS